MAICTDGLAVKNAAISKGEYGWLTQEDLPSVDTSRTANRKKSGMTYRPSPRFFYLFILRNF
jgi:hypothetical protein